jgi:RND superfamily putative drug exporter
MAELLYRIGGFASRRSRTVVLTWFAILAVAAVAFTFGGGHMATGLSIPGTPTAQVTERLATEFPAAAGGNGTVVFHTVDRSALSEAEKAAISARIATTSKIDGVVRVIDPFATQADRATQEQQVATGRAQLDGATAQLAQGQAQLDAAKAQAEAAGTLDQAAAGLAAKQAEIDAGKAQLDAQRAKLDEAAGLLDMSSGIRLVSDDGSAAVAPVMFKATQFDVSPATKQAVEDAFANEPIPGVSVDFSSEIASGIPSIIGVGELVGLFVAAVVLVLMLGTFTGAGLPILSALIGVGIGVLASLSVSGVVDMVSVTPVLGIMLGLAVGIDYSLFIVHRHRRQLKEGYGVHESISLATGTSGNAVVFAGSTVLIALLALNVTGIPFLGVMGTVGALSIAIAVLIALTFTPAMLSIVGERVLRGRERAALASDTAPAAAKPVRPMSTRNAIGRVLLGVGLLVTLAVPAMSMRLGLPDGSSESPSSTQYAAYTTVAEKFGAGMNGPLLVVADLAGSPAQDDVLADQVRIGRQLAAFTDVVAVAPIGTSADGATIAFQVVPADGPTSVSTEQLVKGLRVASPLDGGVQIAVAGQASGNIDISQKLADALPLYLALVVGLSLLIMVVVFRSLFVPVIATGGFILSLFAAFGGVVAIYQWGWLGGIFGVHATAPILNFLPTMLVGILFGLAMDYMLFLASGMREAYVHGAPAPTAVVLGVRAGRSVVTAAAIIMVAVFGGFVFSESAMIRPIGFALAFGVLLDAFVVRMFIVPSLMHLAGDWAWWLPKWLDRLIPNVDVEGAALDRRHPHVAREHTGMDLEADGGQIRPGGTRRMPIPVQAPANAE